MIMAVRDLLKHNPNPSEHEIREGIEGNLCRCTGYQNIVKAAQQAAAAGATSCTATNPSLRSRSPEAPMTAVEERPAPRSARLASARKTVT